MTYSVNNIDINKTYTGTLNAQSVSGTTSIDLSLSNMHKLTLTGDYALNYSNAELTTYNFIVETDGNEFSLGASNFKSVEGTTISSTYSMIVSGIYDGTDMYVSYVEKLV